MPETTDRVVTHRLLLCPPTPADLPELFALYADPRVWRADPLARHDSAEQTERMIGNWRTAWHRDGLGMWTARLAPDGGDGQDGPFVGIGGCFVRYGVAWNLGFRLLPAYWGRGFAQEISAAAFAAARRLRPDLPVTAYILEGNDASRRAVERTGLGPVWRGVDAGNPDPSAVRLLYADRPLSPDALGALTER